jgi:hypothetical protein
LLSARRKKTRRRDPTQGLRFVMKIVWPAILWHHKTMKPSRINSAKKARRGRPPVESEAINVRMALDAIKSLDAWRRQQEDLPGRPEAIRRLVAIGLEATTKKGGKR